MSYAKTFKEKISYYDKDTLKYIASELKLKGVSKLRKADLIEKIAECALDPKALFYRLSVLDDTSMRLFEKGADNVIEIPYNYEEAKHAIKLDRLDVACFLFPSHLLSSLSDVYDIYQKNIAGADFDAYREKVSWVEKCLFWAGQMYVRAPMNIVLKLTNSKNGLHMSKEELTEIFDHLPDEFKSMVFSDGMFISNDYIDDIDELEAILDLQSDKPFYIPTVAEIEEYYDFESLISKKTYQDMQKFLENEAKMDKDEVRNILIDTWCLIAEEDDVPYVIRCFLDRLKLTNKK